MLGEYMWGEWDGWEGGPEGALAMTHVRERRDSVPPSQRQRRRQSWALQNFGNSIFILFYYLFILGQR